MKTSKKALSLFLSVLMIFTVFSFAAISGDAATYVTYGEYKCEVVSEGFVYIAQYLGTDTQLELPKNFGTTRVIGISKGAFENSGITSVVIPEGYTSIGNSAFYNADNITSITLPSSITTIGTSAFSFMDNLSDLDISKATSLTSIPNYMLQGCPLIKSFVVPAFITSVENNAFRGSGLESVSFANPDTTVGSYTFYGCTNLTDVTLPKNLKNILSYTFYGCSSLTSVDIPTQVEVIDDRAFYECTSLKSVDLPASLTKLGARVFYNDTSLTNIYVPDKVTSIGAQCFYPMDIQKTFTADCVEDSYAATYCEENFIDYNTYIFGDFNNDGELNIRDVTAVQEYLVGGYSGTVTDVQLRIADVTRDANLNIRDVSKVQEFLVGSIENL
ncbi:MAG: leucine-rich repeat protein [Ruminococcus sp.]